VWAKLAGATIAHRCLTETLHTLKAISGRSDASAESLSTLKFANRAKNIRNAARVNEDVDQRTLLRKYERELRRLRAELQQRQRELVDKRHLLEVIASLLMHVPLLAGYTVHSP